MTHHIQPIAAAQARLLRHTLLRPTRAPETLVYPGDDHPLALHAGAFREGRLVGVASVVPEPCPAAPERAGWCLRGMATLPEVQHQGCGAALIQTCVAHISAHGGALLWCHGRTSALLFYRALGFQSHGEEFLNPETGPHFLL